MVKKADLQEKEAFEQVVGIKGGFKGGLFSALKFVFAMVMLPLVIGISRAFYQQFSSQADMVGFSFLCGAATYILIHLFLFQAVRINDIGQMLIGKCFGFYVPLRTIMHTCLPFYAIVFFVVYLLVKTFFTSSVLGAYAVFLIAFTATMHFVVTAEYLKKDSRDVLKGDYFFSLFTVYLFEVLLLSAFFRFMFDKFSFILVLRGGFDYFVRTLMFTWQQLFIMQ